MEISKCGLCGFTIFSGEDYWNYEKGHIHDICKKKVDQYQKEKELKTRINRERYHNDPEFRQRAIDKRKKYPSYKK